MKFNSQICTSKSQSERLLALGLKKETADMCIRIDLSNPIATPYNEVDEFYYKVVIPAWSLHRLIKMIPSFIDIGEHSYMFSMIQGRLCSYRSGIAGNALLYGERSVYNSVIYTIEWLIGEGLFNKEYLEE